MAFTNDFHASFWLALFGSAMLVTTIDTRFIGLSATAGYLDMIAGRVAKK